MTYPKCNKCGSDMELTDTELESSFDGVTRIFECEECDQRVQQAYDFEHIEPTNVFWEKDYE